MKTGWLFHIIYLTIFAVFSTHSTEVYSSQTQPFADNKAQIALKLSKTVKACVSRRDTNHIIFNGCIDWHSSVHGMWALIAYMRATGDKRYEALVMNKLTKRDIQAEHDFLIANPDFEMPYGRAWFLRLAIEYSKYTGRDDLKKMADHVLFSMIKYYSENRPDPLDKSYNNSAWALINMMDYALYTENIYALRFAVWTSIENFYVEAQECPLRTEQGHFMAVCSNWVWLVSKVVAKKDFQSWADNFYRINGYPSPVSRPVNWHHFGLNFSRAWGFWHIYKITKEKKYLRLYTDHFSTSYKKPASWRGSYRGVGHWVPQFGMFAIQPIFGKERGR